MAQWEWEHQSVYRDHTNSFGGGDYKLYTPCNGLINDLGSEKCMQADEWSRGKVDGCKCKDDVKMRR